MPRIRRKASNGPRICPSIVRLRRARSHSASAREVASAPATTSEWPLRYLVAACMTMSAPCSSGRVSIGVAAVEFDRQHRPCRMRDLGRRGDVGDRPERIGGRFDPDELRGARPHRRPHRVEIGGVHEVHAEAPVRGIGHEPVAQRPVHDLGRHHVVARRERKEQSGRSRHAGAEDHRRLRALERRDQRFGFAHRAVVGPAVDVAAAVLIVRVADISGRDVDRRHNGARRIVDAAERLRGQRARRPAPADAFVRAHDVRTSGNCFPQRRPRATT